jgi:hypothetical protein
VVATEARRPHAAPSDRKTPPSDKHTTSPDKKISPSDKKTTSSDKRAKSSDKQAVADVIKDGEKDASSKPVSPRRLVEVH